MITQNMTFGQAIEALKKGLQVARKGWNGKGMYLCLQAGSLVQAADTRGGMARCIADEGIDEVIVQPHIDMRAADGTCVVGWLASQTDMLSEDWLIVGAGPTFKTYGGVTSMEANFIERQKSFHQNLKAEAKSIISPYKGNVQQELKTQTQVVINIESLVKQVDINNPDDLDCFGEAMKRIIDIANDN